jgi:hypothetical protein
MRLQSASRDQGAGRSLAVVVLALLAGCAGPAGVASKPVAATIACAERDPVVVVVGFYTAVAKADLSGLPTPAAMEGLRPQLSGALVTAIDIARTRQQAFARAHPDLKPPFAEGSLFSSLFEGPTGVEGADLVRRDRGMVEVNVRLVYAKPGSESAHWSDGVSLRCEGSDWRIDDVVYQGRWDFAASGRLRRMLEEAE